MRQVISLMNDDLPCSRHAGDQREIAEPRFVMGIHADDAGAVGLRLDKLGQVGQFVIALDRHGLGPAQRDLDAFLPVSHQDVV